MSAMRANLDCQWDWVEWNLLSLHLAVSVGALTVSVVEAIDEVKVWAVYWEIVELWKMRNGWRKWSLGHAFVFFLVGSVFWLYGMSKYVLPCTPVLWGYATLPTHCSLLMYIAETGNSESIMCQQESRANGSITELFSPCTGCPGS